MKKSKFFFQKKKNFGGLVAGKSAAKKLKNISFIFKLIFFGGLVAGKSAAKKNWKNNEKYMFFF